MARLLKDRSHKKGLAPGSLVTVASKVYSDVKIKVTNFNNDSIEEKVVNKVEDCIEDVEASGTITWINIEGLADSKVIQNIGKTFGIHVLWLEDVLNTDHRPKLEELDELIFCIIKAVDYDKRKPGKVTFEQVSLFLGKDFVISFQEFPGDVFIDVTNRLEKKKGKIRGSGSDYLFYALIDAIVDEYFTALQKLGEEVENLEKSIFENYSQTLYQEVSRLRNELIYLRKSAAPIGDVLRQCIETEKPEILDRTKKYFKDAFDNILQVSEIIESYFGMLEAARDSFNAVQANKMNEVMKVLTVFSATFIPLTFIAGIYGMNFKNMPELEWPWGYGYAIGIMVLSALGLLQFFRYKKWL